MGLDPRFEVQVKELNGQIDALMLSIDKVKGEATEFYEKYSKELKNKETFDKEMENSKSKIKNKQEPSISLPEAFLEDIRFGAVNIKTVIKEKYLGRLPGVKRGDVTLQYASNALTIVVSLIMMSILGYIQMQVKQMAKNKIF